MMVRTILDKPGGHQPPGGPAAERRQCERRYARLKAEIVRPAIGTGTVYTRDISERGVFLEMSPARCPAVGTAVTLRVAGMFKDEPLSTLVARVVRVTDSGMGLQFFDIDFG